MLLVSASKTIGSLVCGSIVLISPAPGRMIPSMSVPSTHPVSSGRLSRGSSVCSTGPWASSATVDFSRAKEQASMSSANVAAASVGWTAEEKEGGKRNDADPCYILARHPWVS